MSDRYADKQSALDEIYDSTSIATYSKFDYREGANYLRIELFEPSGKRICESVFSLTELAYERFVSRNILLRNPTILENTQNYLFCFTQLKTSFFLEYRQTNNAATELFKIVSSVRKKTPDLIDIFNRLQMEDLSSNFAEAVKQDYHMLDRFLASEQSLDIINESYNYVSIEEYGSLQYQEFL